MTVAENGAKLRGFGAVRVTKDDLLEALQKNRAEHRAIFEEAIETWYERAVERLEKMVKQAKRGPQHVEFNLGLARPDDHTREYDSAIKMVEMSQDAEFELSRQEFEQYVMDEWHWQGMFLAAAMPYSDGASAKMTRMSG